ncbi:hypothetical protein [Sphaerotilus mobilis]|uniref:Histone H1-like nucleoprotein HC2 n=1 Tax=Sphaerotilus mobilis TaxID=47994 RepID=A0A4Q7LE48_9BURK|nr:hypothetical protein EV685_3474 [Sphaerotilus mobilis]
MSNTPAAAPDAKIALVRDSYTMPEQEYAQLDALKRRALALGHPVKKSELLRAGVAALVAMADDVLLAAVQAVPPLKTGRPKGSKAEVDAPVAEVAKPAKAPKVAKVDKVLKAEKVEKVAKPEKAVKAVKAESAEKPAKSAKPVKAKVAAEVKAEVKAELKPEVKAEAVVPQAVVRVGKKAAGQVVKQAVPAKPAARRVAAPKA